MPRAALCTAKGSIDQFCAKAIAGGFTAASAARFKYGAVDRTALQPFKLMNNAVIPTVRADADLTHWVNLESAPTVKRTKVDTFVLVKLFLLLPHAGAIEEKPFKTMT